MIERLPAGDYEQIEPVAQYRDPALQRGAIVELSHNPVHAPA